MIDHLCSVNDVKIYSVFDDEFKPYGKIVDGFDFSAAIEYAENNTEIPDSGNIYVQPLRSSACLKTLKMCFTAKCPFRQAIATAKTPPITALNTIRALK